ncbi:peptidase M23 [Actinoplanes sp. DH11]|uniref:peptidase M23 n=1 Tax=Actinoplanes sp. DH11 TaxID=2857011 RepID=UPI001E2F819B|nr:peptidase M23 [Actinoplanes sp. DH11]
MRSFFVVAVAVLAGFLLSPLLRADAACTPGTAPPAGPAPALRKFSDEQLENARVIVTVGTERQVPRQGLVIAVATALQESRLRNLSYGDRDSVGLFQQRPSQGWGTPEQLSDPAYQAREFYDKLLTIDGWSRMRLTEAAQAVQVSAYPEAYSKHTRAATTLVDALSGPEPACAPAS